MTEPLSQRPVKGILCVNTCGDSFLGKCRTVNIVYRTDASLRGGFGGRNARTVAIAQTGFKAYIVREQYAISEHAEADGEVEVKSVRNILGDRFDIALGIGDLIQTSRIAETDGILAELLCADFTVCAPAQLIVHIGVALVAVQPVFRFVDFFKTVVAGFIFGGLIRLLGDGAIALFLHIGVVFVGKAVVVVNAHLLIHRLLRNRQAHCRAIRPLAVFVQHLIAVDKYRCSCNQCRVICLRLDSHSVFGFQRFSVGLAPLQRIACRNIHLKGCKQSAIAVGHTHAVGNIFRGRLLQLVAFGYGVVGLVVCRVAQRRKVGCRLHNCLDLGVAVGVAHALISCDNAVLVTVAGSQQYLCSTAVVAAVRIVRSPIGERCFKAGRSAVIVVRITIYAGDHTLFEGINIILVSARSNKHDLLSAGIVAVKIAHGNRAEQFFFAAKSIGELESTYRIALGRNCIKLTSGSAVCIDRAIEKEVVSYGTAVESDRLCGCIQDNLVIAAFLRPFIGVHGLYSALHKALVMIVEKHRVCKFFFILEYRTSNNCKCGIIWVYRAALFYSDNSEVLVAVVVEVAADE